MNVSQLALGQSSMLQMGDANDEYAKYCFLLVQETAL